MAQPNAKFAIAITADDKTAKGVAAATRRVTGITTRIGRDGARRATEVERSWRRSGTGLVRTFSAVERAAGRALGTSAAGGVTGRLGALRQAGAAAASGLSQAAGAGGVLSSAMGVLGVAAGATTGILAAAGFAALRMANGWSKGARSIGNLSDTIGVATRDLQSFAAAGERAGVSKDAATGALGGLAQTLNDARYGRNNDAVALLGRLGVKIKTNADGSVDTMGMMPAITDALARQKNAQTRRMVAHQLGISDDALPMFMQGSGQLQADMADAQKHAAVLTDADIANGRRVARKGVIASQLAERGMMIAGRSAASGVEGGYDAAITAGRGIADGQSVTAVIRSTFVPGAAMVERGGRAIERAAERIGSVVSKGALTVARGFIGAAQASEIKYGIPASVTLAQLKLESGGAVHMPPGSNNPFGIKARRGEPFVSAWTNEVDRAGSRHRVVQNFRKYESLQDAFDAHARLLAQSPQYANARRFKNDPVRFADALTGVYATDPTYGSKLRSIMQRDHLTRFDQEAIPVKVEIEMKGAPHGTKARVTAGTGHHRAVAISHTQTGVHP